MVKFSWFDYTLYFLILLCIILIFAKAICIIVGAIKDMRETRKSESEEQPLRRLKKLMYIQDLDTELKHSNFEEMWRIFYEREQVHDLVLLLLYKQYIGQKKGES